MRSPTIKRLSNPQKTWIKARHAKGMAESEITRQFMGEFGRPLAIGQLRTITGARRAAAPSTRVTVRLGAPDLDRLRTLAKDLGFVSKNGPTAGAGNLATMLEAIAAGELTVAPAKTGG